MSDFKKHFRKDFEEANKTQLHFDVTQLEPNEKKDRHKVKPLRLGLVITASVVFAVVAIPAAMVAISFMEVRESVKTYNRRYTLNEIRIAESNSFRKLNEVSYPDGDAPATSWISEEEKKAYSNFANRTYHSLVDTSRKGNMSYSVVGLYSTMNEMSLAASRPELTFKLDSLLGLDETDRAAFYDKVMKANSFARDESTIQLKNAAFFNNKYNYSQDYVDSLADLYCEAYQLSFESDKGKIVEWANEAVKSKGFIDERFLETNHETQLYLLSALYFKNAWANKFLADNNILDDFYIAPDDPLKTTFMRHTYFTKDCFDYGSYISVKDRYYRGNASVTYLVPKKVEDDIFELTEDVNIFEDVEANRMKPEKLPEVIVNLEVPKFVAKSEINFGSCLENIGFEDIFDREVDSFKNAFDDERMDDKNVYIQKIKQKNEVEFNEDGSIVKSLSMASFGAKEGASMYGDTLDVKLNQPFIYIIRDANDTPIFVGHVDNPKA